VQQVRAQISGRTSMLLCRLESRGRLSLYLDGTAREEVVVNDVQEREDPAMAKKGNIWLSRCYMPVSLQRTTMCYIARRASGSSLAACHLEDQALDMATGMGDYAV